MPDWARAKAFSGVSAFRAEISSTVISPKRMASEKQTVQRMEVGAGRSVITI